MLVRYMQALSAITGWNRWIFSTIPVFASMHVCLLVITALLLVIMIISSHPIDRSGVQFIFGMR